MMGLESLETKNLKGVTGDAVHDSSDEEGADSHRYVAQGNFVASSTTDDSAPVVALSEYYKGHARAIHREYEREVSADSFRLKNVYLWTLGPGSLVALGVAGTLAGVVSFATLAGLSCVNWFAGEVGDGKKDSVLMSAENAITDLRHTYEMACKNSYDRQIRTFVEEANRSVLNGYKLDDDVLAHLAAFHYTDYFADACDELKYTVLQLKKNARPK